MIISCIMSGLGNQLFQYANGRAVSLQNNTDFFLDTRWYFDKELFGDAQAVSRMYLLDKFNIKAKPWEGEINIKEDNFRNRFRAKILGRPYAFKYSKDCRLLDKNFLKTKNNSYIYEVSQSWKNFENYKSEIKDELTLIAEPTGKNKEILELIKNRENSVAIHIRRGDKANNPEVHKIHGLCPLEYYEEALNILENKHKKLTCFIFSDDIAWAKENFKTNFEIHFIENNLKEEDAVEDLRLMNACKHHIICNSSFSWWGSYLSENNGTTIAPNFWAKGLSIDLNNLYFPDWIVLNAL